MVMYPSDWATYTFDEMFQLYPNNTLSRDKLSNQGTIGNIHYGDVLIKYGAVLSVKDSIPKIKVEYESSVRAYLQQNDVIVADTAEDETVGKVVQIGMIPFPLTGGLHTIVCRPLVPTATGYLGYYMNSREYHDQLLPYITGIKVSSVSKASIRKTELHIPSSVEEQAAIVDAIERFDTHIANLGELIEKKKAIRDGALEDLVSGRTRLAGYTEPWSESCLGSIGTFTKGAPLSKAHISNTGTPFILYGELYTTYHEVTYKVYRRTEESADEAHYSRVGDVIIPTSGETAEEIATACCVMIPGVILAGDLNIYRSPELDGRFLSYVIKHVVNQQISELAQGISIIHINAKTLKKIVVRYPKHEEQSAIADIIDTMNTEISALEDEREKMIQIREGAMDDLLTGRVRLAV